MKFAHILLCITLLASSIRASEHPRAVVHNEDPQYPEVARKMDLHGTVKLKIWITAEGNVRKVEYIGGHPLLAESALKAVKNWRYAPASQETEMTVEIKF
jgi:protein TonB